MKKSDVIQIRDQIVGEALELVVFDGWVWECVLQAGEACGHSADVVLAVFPEKIADALDHFADMADRAMLDRLGHVDAESMRVRDRVWVAVMARFTYLNEYREAERLALRYWMSPVRKGKALKILWRTCDRIWVFAGDEATDYNHYTKRGLLAGVIGTTSLVWLNDESDDLAVTERFLERRIENVLRIGGTVGKILGRVTK